MLLFSERKFFILRSGNQAGSPWTLWGAAQYCPWPGEKTMRIPARPAGIADPRSEFNRRAGILLGEFVQVH